MNRGAGCLKGARPDLWGAGEGNPSLVYPTVYDSSPTGEWQNAAIRQRDFFYLNDILLCVTLFLSPLGHCDETREETHLEWSWQLGCQD